MRAECPPESPPLRIALFHTTLPEPGRKLGGVEVAVHRLANALSRSPENAVTVFSLTPCPSDARYAHRQLFARQPWLRSVRLARLFILPFLLNFARWGAFDVLHLHGDDWFFFRRPGPTIRTMNGSAQGEARSATSFKRRLMQSLLTPMERLALRLCTLPLALGPETAAIYGIRSIIDYGVDTERFHPGEKSPRPRVLFVGTWEGRKRGRFLCEGFLREVLPCLPEAELCMVSDCCPVEHPRILKEVFPSDERLAQRYREAWVFAYPSTYEGFGIAYLEALASGTAILCSPNEGARHILQDGKCGVIADDAAFGKRLLELLKSAEQRERLAAAGRERAQAFTWDKIAAQHRAFYLEAVNGVSISERR